MNGSKRSLLAQERSRDTRQAIIKAALELWGERGYASGVDETTAEEIAARAGVAKATFYLHFARKDDILLETGWVTTKVFYEDVLKALPQIRSPDEVIDDVTVRLCRRIEKVPRLAMQRILRAQANAFGPRQGQDDGEHFGFQRGFALIMAQAQQAGELPRTVTPASLGGMFEAMLYESLREWAYGDQGDLLAMLRERFAVLLAGARGVTADAISRLLFRGRALSRLAQQAPHGVGGASHLRACAVRDVLAVRDEVQARLDGGPRHGNRGGDGVLPGLDLGMARGKAPLARERDRGRLARIRRPGGQDGVARRAAVERRAHAWPEREVMRGGRRLYHRDRHGRVTLFHK